MHSRKLNFQTRKLSEDWRRGVKIDFGGDSSQVIWGGWALVGVSFLGEFLGGEKFDCGKILSCVPWWVRIFQSNVLLVGESRLDQMSAEWQYLIDTLEMFQISRIHLWWNQKLVQSQTIWKTSPLHHTRVKEFSYRRKFRSLNPIWHQTPNSKMQITACYCKSLLICNSQWIP